LLLRAELRGHGVSAELALVDPQTLALMPGSGLSRSFPTGSHLFNWNRLAANG
jgi:hypothetical protein